MGRGVNRGSSKCECHEAHCGKRERAVEYSIQDKREEMKEEMVGTGRRYTCTKVEK